MFVHFFSLFSRATGKDDLAMQNERWSWYYDLPLRHCNFRLRFQRVKAGRLSGSPRSGSERSTKKQAGFQPAFFNTIARERELYRKTGSIIVNLIRRDMTSSPEVSLFSGP
jgi:hypothetical protein